MASQHLRSAIAFALRCKEIEGGTISPSMDQSEYLAFATASIFMVVAHAECLINEIILDGWENEATFHLFTTEQFSVLQNLQPSLQRRLRSRSYVKKFEAVLSALTGVRLDENVPPLSELLLVNQFRNALVHYYPETTRYGDGPTPLNPRELQLKLAGTYTMNPIDPPMSRVFPNSYLSYGCCKWAIDAIRNFVDAFYLRSKIVPLPEQVKYDEGFLKRLT